LKKTFVTIPAVLFICSLVNAAVLTSNIGNQQYSSFNISDFLVGQAFTAGSSGGIVKRIKLMSGTSIGDPTAAAAVYIYSDNSGVPYEAMGSFALAGTLTTQSEISYEDQDGITLSADTDYWVVANAKGFNLMRTNDLTQTGWEIADQAFFKIGSWQQSQEPAVVMLELDSVPEPATAIIMCLGGFILKTTKKRSVN
jgi:hypothetical protein